MPKYLIIDGTFLDADGSVKGPGQYIELGQDIAEANRRQVAPAEPPVLTDMVPTPPAEH